MRMLRTGLIRFLLVFMLVSCRQKSSDIQPQMLGMDTVNPEPVKRQDSLFVIDTLTNEPHKPVITETEQRIIDKGLENVQDHLPSVVINLKYSTSDNFLGADVYGELTNAYLQPECISKLKRAWRILQQHKPGYTFIIYDALRPVSVQQMMWDTIDVPPEKKFWYVAPPGRGSIHNYGMAVDLTIADSSGNPLDMGTEFDYFGKLAFPRFSQRYLEEGRLSRQQVDNRRLLIDIMHQSGFTVARTEWWHFNATSLADAKERFEPIP
ncbi:MAG: M15 family metallopeptidase [Bacteroidales bacterium]